MKKRWFFGLSFGKKAFLLGLILFLHLLLIPLSFWGKSLLVSSQEQVNQVTSEKQVAIVIDDFGGTSSGTSEILALPYPITVAVMPYREHTKEDVEAARKVGFEVILHLPMEPQNGKISWLGPNPITTALSSNEVRERVLNALKEVPGALGINNHMGSKATEDERVVREVVKVVKENELFLLDSRTTMETVMAQVAQEYKVPYLKRDVFLDNVNSLEAIRKQFDEVIKVVEEQGYAVAIGHVGPTGDNMAKALVEKLPELEAKGIKIVPLSQLYQSKRAVDTK